MSPIRMLPSRRSADESVHHREPRHRQAARGDQQIAQLVVEALLEDAVTRVAQTEQRLLTQRLVAGLRAAQVSLGASEDAHQVLYAQRCTAQVVALGEGHIHQVVAVRHRRVDRIAVVDDTTVDFDVTHRRLVERKQCRSGIGDRIGVTT